MNSQEYKTLRYVVHDFYPVWDLLERYDHEELEFHKNGADLSCARVTYEEVMEAIAVLKRKTVDDDDGIFGVEKDASFKSSLGQIYQTFDGRELYPTVEIKAATLLYLIVKNHSFVDGNKRIAAFVFLWFLSRNGLLWQEDGSMNIACGTVVALTLLIAESKPEEQQTMIKLTTNFLGFDCMAECEIIAKTVFGKA